MLVEVLDFTGNGVPLFCGEVFDVLVKLFEAVDYIKCAILAFFKPPKIWLNPCSGISRALAVKFIGQFPEMLLDVVKVNTLDGVLETVIGYVPYPDCTVCQDKHIFGFQKPTLKSLCVQLPLEAFDAPTGRD